LPSLAEVRKKFAEEYRDHDLYCDGEGRMVQINRYTAQTNLADCRWCVRMERAAKAAKEAIREGRIAKGN